MFRFAAQLCDCFGCLLESQVHFLGADLSLLHEEVDPSQLPTELGGTLPPFSTEYTTSLLQAGGSDVDGEPGSKVWLQHRHCPVEYMITPRVIISLHTYSNSLFHSVYAFVCHCHCIVQHMVSDESI